MNFTRLLHALALLTVTSLTATADDAATRMGSDAQKLQGAWRATDDANVVVRFDNGVKRESYDKQTVTQVSYQVLPNCPHADLPPGGQYIVTSQDECFAIVSVTNDELSLGYVSGRGNTLTYMPFAELLNNSTQDPIHATPRAALRLHRLSQ